MVGTVTTLTIFFHLLLSDSHDNNIMKKTECIIMGNIVYTANVEAKKRIYKFLNVTEKQILFCTFLNIC